MGESYKDIELDEDPVIVPQCGHILTRTNMDGHLDMAKHYESDQHGAIAAVKAASEPFSYKEMKRCPTCRGLLRNLSRYGRVVRRSLLDESSKRFIMLANKDYVQLESKASEQEEFLRNSEVQRALQAKLELGGPRSAQIISLSRLPLFSSINKDAFNLHRTIQTYVTRVAKEEQPYNQVRDMIASVRRRKGAVREEFSDDILTVQMRHYLLGTTLLLRFELSLLSTVVGLTQKNLNDNPLSENAAGVRADFGANRTACVDLAAAASEASQPRPETEAHLLFARYAALEFAIADKQPSNVAAQNGEPKKSTNETRERALAHLAEATRLCDKYPGSTRGLLEEIKATETMLRGSWFEPVSSDERRQVLLAMQSEFRGTGHWYVVFKPP